MYVRIVLFFFPASKCCVDDELFFRLDFPPFVELLFFSTFAQHETAPFFGRCVLFANYFYALRLS